MIAFLLMPANERRWNETKQSVEFWLILSIIHDYLRPLRLARMITLGLNLRNSIENLSMTI